MSIATSRRPMIGIPVGRSLPRQPDYLRLRQTYTLAVVGAGGVPFLIPPLPDRDALRRLTSTADGLLFPGGVDIHPGRYAEEIDGTQEIDEALDELEFQLAEWAVADELPTLGICRGQQVLNVALGGSLVQDLESAGSVHPQSGVEVRDRLVHSIELIPGSRLAGVLGSTTFQVNSHHHQAVARLGRGLRTVGRAPDGVIEAVEHTDHPWLFAVQFHPEDLVDSHQPSQRLFAAFVEACASRVVVSRR
jgi:putative glutamine amidotransferase